MANRLHSSTHATGPATASARAKKGTKNRGVAAGIKLLKREEAIDRQQANIDRGYYLCHDFNTSCPGSRAIQLGETAYVLELHEYNGFHAHTPAPLERQVRDKSNQKHMVSVF